MSVSFCHKRFSRPQILIKHTRIHTGEKPYGCNQCEKKFISNEKLVLHLRILHTGEKPFGCMQCSKKFVSKDKLNNHVLVHSGIKNFICSHCGKKFPRKDSLKRHNTNIHNKSHNKNHNDDKDIASGTSKKPFCSICNKHLANKYSYDYHMRQHSGEKPYCCENCSAQFSNYQDLWMHRKENCNSELMCTKKVVCANTKSSCPICNKLCNSSYYLKKHMNRHTQEKKYSCYQCKKIYFFKDSLISPYENSCWSW